MHVYVVILIGVCVSHVLVYNGRDGGLVHVTMKLCKHLDLYCKPTYLGPSEAHGLVPG